jgi:hypothetical protein
MYIILAATGQLVVISRTVGVVCTCLYITCIGIGILCNASITHFIILISKEAVKFSF